MEMRTAYHKKLREIQYEIMVMGSMVSKALIRSVEALKNRNLSWLIILSQRPESK